MDELFTIDDHCHDGFAGGGQAFPRRPRHRKRDTRRSRVGKESELLAAAVESRRRSFNNQRLTGTAVVSQAAVDPRYRPYDRST